jgi:hypothetical protein
MNGFKDKTMRREYDAGVRMWETKDRNLFYPDGTICRGSSFAVYFWDGFNKTGRQDYDPKSRQMTGFAYFRAGQDCAKKARV